MASILSPSLCSWSRCIPSFLSTCNRSFGSRIKGSWNKPPICKGRKIDRTEKKCHPKHSSCPGVLSACGIIRQPKCDEPGTKTAKYLKCCCDHNLTKDACSKAPKKKRKHEEEKPFKSMWETCGLELKRCPEFIPRLDETHYHSSDKTKRVYTKTWKTCENLVRKKKVCCLDGLCDTPPLKKRCKEKIPETAKEQNMDLLKVDYSLLKRCSIKPKKKSNIKGKNKCIKIVMPCCRKVAKNLKCHVSHGHKHCLKECCPHPSFSECDHPKLRKRPPQECRCGNIMSQCETNRFFAYKKKFKLPPPLPAWPPEKPK